MHPLRPMRPLRPMPTPDPYSGKTFARPTGDAEALPIVGLQFGTFHDVRCQGGSCPCRLIECGNLTLINWTFRGALGTPDPDGHLLQIVRPTGPIRLVSPRFIFGPTGEDGLNVYADKPCAGSVTVEDGEWFGRGNTDSGNSFCADGPFAPPLVVKGGTVDGARCAGTFSGGRGHHVEGVKITRSDVKFYVYRGYDQPVGVTFSGYKVSDVLLGAGLAKGSVLVQG